MCVRYLLWEHTTQDAQGLSRDHSCQKQVLCCLVMGAQMSFGYQCFPCLEFRDAAEGDGGSHLTYWSPPATHHGHAQSFSSAGDPWGLCATAAKKGTGERPECSLLASGTKGSAYRGTQHVGPRFPPCAALQCMWK